MPRTSNASPLLRCAALAVMVSVPAAGSELPMCFSLLAQTTAPCEMHAHRPHAGAHGGHSEGDARALPGPQMLATGTAHLCHGESGGVPCETGGACPSGGAATVSWANAALSVRELSRTPLVGPPAAFRSHLAPPPSPPPQA